MSHRPRSASELADAFDGARRAGSAGNGAAEAGESMDGALTQAQARELRGWTGRIGQAEAQVAHLCVRRSEPLFQRAPLPCHEHHEHDCGEEERDHRQNRQVSHRCFHDRLPGTTAVN